MSDTKHVQRIKDVLEEIDHLRYVEVTECPYDAADVRVQVADHIENALVNNGEFAQFHGAGYVGHHVNFERQSIDLRSIESDTDRSEEANR
jgi:cytochrome c556